MHERSLCTGCGHKLNETLDPDREGWYTAEVESCAGCRAREMELKLSPPEPGMRVRVVADEGYEKRS